MPVRLERLKLRPQFPRRGRRPQEMGGAGLRPAGPPARARRRPHPPRRPADPTTVRVGFTASRKVGGAVERNRASGACGRRDRVPARPRRPGLDLC